MRAGCVVGYSLLCFSLEAPGARSSMAPSEPIHLCLVRLPAMLLWANCGERCGYQCCWQIQSHVLPVCVLYTASPLLLATSNRCRHHHPSLSAAKLHA